MSAILKTRRWSSTADVKTLGISEEEENRDVWLDIVDKSGDQNENRELVTFDKPTRKTKWRKRLAHYVNHLIVNIVIIGLIAVDAAIIFAFTLKNVDNTRIYLLSYALLGIFIVEILLRLLATGLKFFRNFFAVLDAALVLLTVFLYLDLFTVSMYFNKVGVIIVQCGRICNRLFGTVRALPAAARQLVSTNKNRYQQNGFDLDLAYINDRIIAMGLPSTNLEAVYRNPIDEVARFFNSIHRQHYLIINLCSERAYSSIKFDGRVMRFPFDDHNPAPMPTMLHFCTLVEDFLLAHPSNVVAIHCKGGKGRTGMMIAAFLLYSNPDLVTEQVLKIFAFKRTNRDRSGKLQGVAGPSQIRYIHQFEQLRSHSSALIAPPGVGGVPRSPMRASSELYAIGAAKVAFKTLTLNQVTLKHLPVTTDKAIDDFNREWNNVRNWSLVITQYPPSIRREPSKEAKWNDDPAQPFQEYMYTHDAEVKEYFFRPQPRNLEDHDCAVRFQVRSWQPGSTSLTLSGDLKVQIFRGNMDVAASPASSAGLGLQAAGHDASSSGATASGDPLSPTSSVVEVGGGAATEDSAGTQSKPRLFAWFWVHTSFLDRNGSLLTLNKTQLDEVCRDGTIHPEFNLSVEYQSLPDDAAVTATLPSSPARPPLSVVSMGAPRRTDSLESVETDADADADTDTDADSESKSRRSVSVTASEAASEASSGIAPPSGRNSAVGDMLEMQNLSPESRGSVDSRDAYRTDGLRLSLSPAAAAAGVVVDRYAEEEEEDDGGDERSPMASPISRGGPRS